MSLRALSFGVMAEAYERFRPGYPAELYDIVSAYAGRPIRTALEIGAGTGKATRVFAERGVEVTATEPDAAMLAELRKTAPAGVTTVQSTFEDLRADVTYELVYVAAALHWTREEGRWARMAAHLEPDGVFANFAGPIELADPELRHAVRAARAPFLEEDGVPSPDGTAPEAPMQWPGTELQKSPLFTDVRQIEIPRRLTISAHEFIGYLSTVSAYLQLPELTRHAAYDAVAQVLPATLEIDADLTGHLARRRLMS